MAETVLVIPAFEEKASLPAVLAAVASDLPSVHCVVVDDGSADETARVAAEAGVVVLRHPFNLGYGAALQTGYKYALARGARIVVQIDGDGQHLPSEVAKVLEPVERGDCDLAIGSRFLAGGDYAMKPMRSIGRRLFSAVARLFGLRITDPTSGFQAMNQRVLELYVSEWYPSDFPDVDVLLMVHRSGLRVQEFAVEMRGDSRSSKLHDGWRPVYYAYKMLLSLWALNSHRRVGEG